MNVSELPVTTLNCSGFCDSPEEVEGFVLQHQAAVSCQVELLQSCRQRVRQLDLSQLITAKIDKLRMCETHMSDHGLNIITVI